MLMRLFPAHLRKPASDTYLRDYLIGGVVRIEYANMNSNRWFFLAVATLVILAFGIYRFSNQGRYAFRNAEGSILILDTVNGDMHSPSLARGESLEFQRPLRVKRQ